MLKVLFTWELGMGLGHIFPIRALATHFVATGHEVYIALKDLKHGHSVFLDMPVTLLQAPINQSIATNAPIKCYSQLLAANGFNNASELTSHCLAWQALYELINPDILFFDHSPTAIVASRGLTAITVNMGTGFTIPPDQVPFALFQPGQLTTTDKQSLLDHEQSIVKVVNQVLCRLDKPVIERLGKLYSDVTFSIFQSLPEFDHFSARLDGRYIGVTQLETELKMPVWPKNSGKKIFIYLKPFEHIERILETLVDTETSVIFFTNDINHKRFESYQNKNICFESEPININAVAKEANIAITNGNHGTLMQFILNRVPVMMIPLHWEQQLLALRMQEQGIGVLSRKDQPDQIIQKLNSILLVNGCSTAVEKLAAKYQGFDGQKLQKQFCRQLIQEAEGKNQYPVGNISAGAD